MLFAASFALTSFCASSSKELSVHIWSRCNFYRGRTAIQSETPANDSRCWTDRVLALELGMGHGQLSDTTLVYR